MGPPEPGEAPALPSTMLDLAMNPEEALRAPLNTTKLAPVTATQQSQPTNDTCRSTDTHPLTCAALPRHAVGLRLVIPVVVLQTDQVRVGLRAQRGADADDVFVGGVYHLLHLLAV